MKYDRFALGQKAKELGFVRDTFEKVCRLTDVLTFINQDVSLKDVLALKGGTAINLAIFDLPRLSVDIDLDFMRNTTREEMLKNREIISEHIKKFMTANGYYLDERSRRYHALDSFVFGYRNAAGIPDNIKIEINYMLRCHIFDPQLKEIKAPWRENSLLVLIVDPIEIFASKIIALMNRAAPRDLFDLAIMIRSNHFNEFDREMLRKCAVFYGAIGSQSVPISYSFDSIMEIKQNRIKTDLVPVLRSGEFFNVAAAQETCTDYLKKLFDLTENEHNFLQSFRDKKYRPDLLFPDDEISSRIIHHPMALWKCGRNR